MTALMTSLGYLDPWLNLEALWGHHVLSPHRHYMFIVIDTTSLIVGGPSG
jgi:hypothetical protein